MEHHLHFDSEFESYHKTNILEPIIVHFTLLVKLEAPRYQCQKKGGSKVLILPINAF